jgi:hypothetical protein
MRGNRNEQKGKHRRQAAPERLSGQAGSDRGETEMFGTKVIYEGPQEEVAHSLNTSVIRRFGWIDVNDELPPNDQACLDVMVMQYDEAILEPQMLVEHRFWIGGRFMGLSEYFNKSCPWAEIDRVDYWLRILPANNAFFYRALENSYLKGMVKSGLLIAR